MVALSSQHRLAAAIEHARDVALVAYLLPRGAVRRALQIAARRGARVTVRLEGRPSIDARGGIARTNARAVAELRACGADARLVDEDGRAPQLHIKSARVDRALYLDDVNFARGGTLLRVSGRIPAGSLACRKRAALDLEARMLQTARGRVRVETESLGSGNAVYARLERLGRAGKRPELLVARRAVTVKERVLADRLRQNGVDVRACESDEKLAVAGARAWIGSANATWAYGTPDQIDWGLRTQSARLAGALRRRFEERWRTAREI